MEKNMLFGISLTIWIVMLVCGVIAVLYVLIVDKKEGKRAEKRKYLAILMCIAIAVLATVLSKQQAYVGAPMIGLIVGILIVNIVPEGKMSKEFKSGTVFAGKRYLSLDIVFLGATLAFSDLFSAVYALPYPIWSGAKYCMNRAIPARWSAAAPACAAAPPLRRSLPLSKQRRRKQPMP